MIEIVHGHQTFWIFSEIFLRLDPHSQASQHASSQHNQHQHQWTNHDGSNTNARSVAYLTTNTTTTNQTLEMKFNYKLRRLCGSYYGHPSATPAGQHVATQWSGSNLVYDEAGNCLISATLNRIQVIDLKNSVSVRTLPVEARSNIRCLALQSPLLIAVDVQNHALLINYHRGVVLHRFKFNGTVRCIEFAPAGHPYLAVAVGKHVQVWYTPSFSGTDATEVSTFAPLHKHRNYTGLSDDIVSIQWSSDGSVIAACSRDTTVRLWTLHTIRNFEPITLAGHKSAVRGVYFGPIDHSTSRNRIQTIYTVSEDGTAVTWECQYEEEDQDRMLIQVQQEGGKDQGHEEEAMLGDEAVNFFSGGGAAPTATTRSGTTATDSDSAHQLVLVRRWTDKHRRYFNQQGGGVTVTSTSYCPRAQLLAVGFSSGTFGLYEMPDLANIHTLSVGANQLVQTCTLNRTGDWLALACPASQQLLVWEWRSETYVLKQRGHAYGMRCMSYAPDAVVVATGGEDGQLKLWNANTGFCYVTMRPHTAPVTAVSFANASVVITASLDGTVQAHDLHRYRTFKTLTTPTPTQFLCLAVDNDGGEIVVAGSTDPFHIYCWSLQTGQLLDVLTGHVGPVCDLDFAGGVLASASWDGTVKTWDVFKSNAAVDSFQHSTDVVCVAFRLDGQQVCTGTIGGLLSFWNVSEGKLLFEIDGRRDIAGGRKLNDRVAANNNAASRYFTSVCYSADGSCVLAGGNSKFVCIYEVSQQVLLKKFQVSYNRSLDGVLDELNSKNLHDGGPVHEEADSGDEANYNALNLPGAKRGDDGSRKSNVEVLTMQVSFSPTGREWAIVSGEGLHIYSLDDDMIFDPIALTEAITPVAVEAKLAAAEYSMALRMAIHLNEFALVKNVLEHTPFRSISHVVRSIGPEQLERFMQFVTKILSDGSPHVEFYLQWCLDLLQTHGRHMERHRGSFMRALRAMHKVVGSQHDELKTICDENRYTLAFLQDQTTLMLEQEQPSEASKEDAEMEAVT